MFCALCRLVGRQASASVVFGSISLRKLVSEMEKLTRKKELSRSQHLQIVRSLVSVGLVQVFHPNARASLSQVADGDLHDETTVSLVPSTQEVHSILRGDVERDAQGATSAFKVLERRNWETEWSAEGGEQYSGKLNYDSLKSLMYYRRGSTGRIKLPEFLRKAVLDPLHQVEDPATLRLGYSIAPVYTSASSFSVL